ncbi:MAG: MFS transporter [Myxococcota bacterium]
MDSSVQIGLQHRTLVFTTAVAVVSDAVLIPFYPQLFREGFGVEDPNHVGLYLAATCLVVMFVLPIWAQLEKRIPTLALLVVAQGAAGLLAIGCYQTSSLNRFWLLSLGMIVFKASYLLVYPYLLRLQEKSKHLNTIGLLTVIVHLGAIAGATVGGWVIESFGPRHGFLVMAGGDFLQMGVCVVLLARGARPPQSETVAAELAPARVRWARVAKLATVMLTLYFGAFVLRPFFAAYWAMRSSVDSELLSGLVFSIPAWMSLACLAYQHYRPRPPPILKSLSLCMVGLVLQGVPHVAAILLGLAIFGWSLFRAMVHLDALIFETNPPEEYGWAFSQMNFFQQLGALFGFYAAGTSVAAAGLVAPFMVALAGFLLTALGYYVFFARGGERDDNGRHQADTPADIDASQQATATS